MSAAALDLAPFEQAYVSLVRKWGVPAPIAKRLDVQPPVADDGETDCWTHAWHLADRLGARYVEGLARRPGYPGPSMHAWVEEDTPLGPVLVECTAGYEAATMYKGITLDTSLGGVNRDLTDDWEDPRSSVLHAALLAAYENGVTPEQVLAVVRA